MSWDADLIDDRGHSEGQWNYTHNCNPMANDALRAAGIEPTGGTWWWHIDDMTGPDGAAVLSAILDQFAADPERYRAMNPKNGWGDYDSFAEVLREMCAGLPEWPTRWTVSG